MKPIIVFKKYKPRELVRLVKDSGSDDFMSGFDSEEYFHLLPDLKANINTEDFHYSNHSGVLLKDLVYVIHHTDDSVGNLVTEHSLFVLLSGGKNFQLSVWCEDADRRYNIDMKPGDWVLFKDCEEHCVMAETKWCGMAIQIGKLSDKNYTLPY